MSRLTLALVLSFLAAPVTSIACSVVVMPGEKVREPTMAEKVAAADAIFVGHVESISEFHAVEESDRVPFGPRLVLRFRLIETIKGETQEPGAVYISSSSCDPPPPDVGSDVLIWVRRDGRTGRDTIRDPMPMPVATDSPYLNDVRRIVKELQKKEAEKTDD